jgi:hypothetical protein
MSGYSSGTAGVISVSKQKVPALKGINLTLRYVYYSEFFTGSVCVLRDQALYKSVMGFPEKNPQS